MSKSSSSILSVKSIYILTVSILLISLVARLVLRQPQVIIGNAIFTVEIANDDNARQRGLAWRESIPEDEGMLFIFNREWFHSFWMKGMEFNLDIIWINEDMKIVHIERNVSPNTYPQSFTPPVPAKYVLELNGGSFYEYGISVGQTVKFKNI